MVGRDHQEARVSDLFDLNGRVCIVTGSTMGLGRASAERMAEHGAQVVVTSRKPEDAAAAAAEINQKLGTDRAIGLGFELQDRASGKALVAGVLDRFGRIDTLMCNAAHIFRARLHEMGDDLEELQQSLTSNVVNYAALTKEVAPAMARQGGGSVIYVLSTLGFFGSPPFLPYSLAKAALAHMTRVLAVDYGDENIRVNSIVPGSFRTASKFQTNEQSVQKFIGKIPLKRQGAPDEIAGLAVLLASPSGAYATGQSFIIDGGQLLKGMEGAQEGYDAVTGYQGRG
jgi:NAD(P)-dependent dehydrogenase (short-subunit alcohol dehydrogenase family)